MIGLLVSFVVGLFVGALVTSITIYMLSEEQ